MLKSSSLQSERAANRTGLMIHPEQNRRLVEGALGTAPQPAGDPQLLGRRRAAWSQDCIAIGSPLLPVESARSRRRHLVMPRDTAELLLDQLGERLQFERTGVRLYEALIAKREQYGDGASVVFRGLPALPELRRIRQDELKHYALLERMVLQLGGDPTAISPSADVVSVIGQGLTQVLTDPRTGLPQCLQAILCAELQDNDGWQLLGKLARSAGLASYGPELDAALQEEKIHLYSVRSWLSAMLDDRIG